MVPLDPNRMRSPPTPIRPSHLLELVIAILAGASWILWENDILTDREAVTALFATVVALWTALIYNVLRARPPRHES
ncbi:MAG: hypothetical protein J5J06_10045 [Phycisphaerae bacterium]|nr:hypothetical protein [Phycisphaerae bacterium]